MILSNKGRVVGGFIVLLLTLTQHAGAQSGHRPRIALALSGGAAYSLSEFGALEWLEEHRIPVDGIVGTSGGAIVGGWYATGLELLTDEELAKPLRHDSPADMRLHGVAEILDKLNLNHIFHSYPQYDQVDVDAKEHEREFPFGALGGFRDGRFTFTDGIVPGSDIENLLDTIAQAYPVQRLYDGSKGEPFDHLPTPFRSVAVQPHGYDVHRWEKVVLGEQRSLPKLPGYQVSLQDAIRSSMAIPYVFTPRYFPPRWESGKSPTYELVDGGLRDNYPTDVAANDLHPDVVIGLQIKVDLNPLNLFYKVTGHGPGASSDLEIESNSFKPGKDPRQENLSVRMRLRNASPYRFDDWRHLSFLGYDSMQRFAAGPDGKRLLALSLSPAEYDAYRRERRTRRQTLSASKPESQRDEITSKLGLGSIGSSDGSLDYKPRYIGQTQLFGELGADGATGDRSDLGPSLGIKSYGLGSKYSSLEGDFQAGSSSNATLSYRYSPQPTSWFLRPYLKAESEPLSEFINGKRAVSDQVGDNKAGLQTGVLVGTRLKISAASEIGTISIGPDQHFLQQIARLQYDDTNSEQFPLRGLSVSGMIRDLSIGSAAPSLYQSQVSAEYRATVLQLNTLIFRGEAGTSFGARPPYQLDFGLGGYGSLQGVPTDWITSPSYTFESFGFGRVVRTLPFYLGKVSWLSGVEFAQADDRSYKDLYTGILTSSRLGQIYFGASVSPNYRPRLILSIGSQPMRGTPLLGASE